MAKQFAPATEKTLNELFGETKDTAFVGGAYEGASRMSRELATWSPAQLSADDELTYEKRTIDARAKDVMRNDAFVAGGTTVHKDNIVGSTYLLNAKPDYELLGLSEEWAEKFQKEVEAKFNLAAGSHRNHIDASGVNDFTSLVRLAVGTFLAGGEILATVEWVNDPRRPFKTAIQMIDADRLSNPNGEMDSENLRSGVEKDKYGKPIAYYIQTHYPTELTNDSAPRWKRVPATKAWGRQQVIHIVEQLRPGQTRGVSAMASALKELRTTKRFRDIVLQNAVLNATFAASIESELPTDTVAEALGGGTTNPFDEYAQKFLGAVTEYSGGSKNLILDGVRVPHLFPGTKLQLRPAGQGGPLGGDFEQSLLRYIAAALGVSYEQLSKDYSQTNYSSIRAAMTETWKYMQSRKRLVADRFASAVYMLWLEEMIQTGKLETVPKNAPTFYEGLNAEAYARCEWIGASRGQIDELKETQAASLRIRYNLSTFEDEMARLGKDWRDVIKQRAREQQIMEEMGLVIERKDDMMNAVTGAPRDKDPHPATEPDGEPEDE